MDLIDYTKLVIAQQFRNLEYILRTSPQRRTELSNHSDLFNQDFLTYLNEVYPLGLKSAHLKPDKFETTKSLLSMVSEKKLRKYNEIPNLRCQPENLSILTTLYLGHSTIAIPLLGFSLGTRKLSMPMVFEANLPITWKYSLEWNIRKDFPMDVMFYYDSALMDGAVGPHFKFLPKRALKSEDLNGYLLDLGRSSNSAEVYDGGKVISLKQNKRLTDGKIEETRNKFHYIGAFQSQSFGKEIHVYAHDCTNGRSTKITSPISVNQPVLRAVQNPLN